MTAPLLAAAAGSPRLWAALAALAGLSAPYTVSSCRDSMMMAKRASERAIYQDGARALTLQRA